MPTNRTPKNRSPVPKINLDCACWWVLSRHAWTLEERLKARESLHMALHIAPWRTGPIETVNQTFPAWDAGRPDAAEDWQHACELRQALDEFVERFKASGQLEIVIGKPPDAPASAAPIEVRPAGYPRAAIGQTALQTTSRPSIGKRCPPPPARS